MTFTGRTLNRNLGRKRTVTPY